MPETHRVLLSLTDWEMRSSRNDTAQLIDVMGSLTDWEMRSSRNPTPDNYTLNSSLTDWEMRSSRNMVVVRPSYFTAYRRESMA